MSVDRFDLLQEAILNRTVRAIAIGASAGAVEALSSILPVLPSHSSLALLIVVHIPPDRESALVELFQRKCAIRICEAEDKEQIKPSTAYFAPPDYHLLVESGGYLSLSVDVPVHYSRPSIDVLFESAADAYGADLLGVILTGANGDGAKGLKKINDQGGWTVVQRPDEAEMSAMPEAALKACPEAIPLTLNQIASLLKLGKTHDAKSD